MCGIIGFKGYGDKNAVFETLMALEKLEYRGYDSSGIAYLRNGTTFLIKQAGCVEDLLLKVDPGAYSNNCIGHTRWATHGKPSKRNAHPHVTSDLRLSIVHNGIIENYLALKKELEAKRYKFLSDTDTEVLLYLIYDHLVKDKVSLKTAVKLALSRVVGAYAFILIDKQDPDVMICAKKGSPLAIGISRTEDHFYVSSDPVVFPKYVENVIYVEENSIVKITDKIKTYNIDSGSASKHKIEKLQNNWLDIEKNGYEYFMQKEIYEQPKSIKNTIAGRIDGYRIVFGGLLGYEKIFEKAKHITIIACGTSWNAAQIGKYYIEEFCNKKVSVEYASEFRYSDKKNIKPEDIVIGISQSGETADTLEALKKAKDKGCHVIGICNSVNSSISRLTECGIYLKAGTEIGVASTKAFTSQVVTLLMLSLWISQNDYHNDHVYNETRKMLIQHINDIDVLVSKSLFTDGKMLAIAKELKDVNKFIFIGRQYNYPVALEGALKMKELCYNHAEGYAAAELKHGPIALVDDNTVAIAVNNNVRQTDKMNSNIQEIKSRGGRIINIDCSKNTSTDVDYNIQIPIVHSCLSPIMSVVPLQLFAYHSAVFRGKNVDRPRNLAKSVTVE
tara:strand:+ start:2012 stop:3859 length:1848 start_codon:yes stop_codon:yes gene_type:complete